MPYPGYIYSNYQQQYQNPVNYFTQPMQQQIQQQQLGLNGKIVESIENVKMTDIPMDGNSYYFPKADGKEIYSKRWLANGSTEIIVYKKFVEEQQEEVEKFNFSEMESNIMEKLNSIDERFAKFEKGFNSKTVASKKEG